MEADAIITIIAAVLASGGLWTTIQLMITGRQTKEKDRDEERALIRASLLGLLHEQLLYRYNRIIDRGEVTEREFRDIETYLFKPYHDLGGNGIIEELRNRAQEMLSH